MATKILKLTARQARVRFGEIVACAKAGDPTIVTFHGRPLAVVVPTKAIVAALAGDNAEQALKPMFANLMENA
jgi:prevent-host-death family protein